jgi:hypothetical protein
MTGTDTPSLQLVLLVVLAAVLTAGAAFAQPVSSPEARMMAQALFEEGRKLMEDEDYDAACVKFDESNRLDPAIGTQFHLADCYEMTDRLASAWVLFVDVAAAARAKDQPEREAKARLRAGDLEPRLNRMIVDVTKPFEGLEVKRNGTPVGSGQWGTAIPVDAGEHSVTAEAQSHKGWRKTLRIKGEGKTVRVVVPALSPLPIKPRPYPKVAPKPPSPPKPAPPPETTNAVSVRSAAALAMGVLGLVALGIGTGAGIVAINKTSEAEKFCSAEGCFDRGLSLREEARRAAAAATVSFAVGGSALVSGLIIWLTIPSDPAPQGSAFGVTFQGRW